jgi:hypothetical protein
MECHRIVKNKVIFAVEGKIEMKAKYTTWLWWLSKFHHNM